MFSAASITLSALSGNISSTQQHSTMVHATEERRIRSLVCSRVHLCSPCCHLWWRWRGCQHCGSSWLHQSLPHAEDPAFRPHRRTYSLSTRQQMHEHSSIHTHIHTQPFNGPLSGTTWVSRYQKKHSPTHTHPNHQTSFINFLHLLRSIASSLFNLRAWQFFSTTSLQVLFGFPLGLKPSTSYSIHFFTQSLSSFRNACPYDRNLFCCRTEIMLSSLNLSLSSLFGNPCLPQCHISDIP